MHISWSEITIRLALAALFGAIIGLERERKDWAAGLRTHMMVCVGASLTMMVSVYGFTDILGTPNVVLDPSRIAAQVISGIGFIGAGTILFLKQGIIRGLTTASGLWTVAAIGLASGAGMYFAAAIATGLAIFILLMLQPLEKKFTARFAQRSLRITTSNREKSVTIIGRFFENTNMDISTMIVEQADTDFIVSLKFNRFSKEDIVKIIAELQLDDDITEVAWNG
ncbi:putative Mg2+ transporter-C (MgtC) family protein [Pedobacter cryoconitis]|uniref:Putative Mg2+ transporter-C (MgtC) family protein n=1 Tax=Pedobacter cryoconitis TaxID=188932 RepID=A0A7W9E0I0_9SPHI|nr:MgtC/SapB family protein [Pedobacter cryoconitis]MBB5638452.1 putative Mg2+ transporter-C (MgtC) family protein [Pedobacter cryoconitis]